MKKESDKAKAIRKASSVVKAGFKIAMAYKFDFLLGALTTPISLFIYYYLWKGIYSYSGAVTLQGYTFEEMITYFVLSTIVGFFVWSNVDRWIENDILEGELVHYLLRPIDYIADSFYGEVGMKIMNLAVQGLPIVLLSHFVLGLLFTGYAYLIFGIISLILASTIMFIISMTIGFFAFWLGRIQGISRMKRAFIVFMSGGMIPLTFFPSWFITASNYLPFQYIRYVPVNVYLGKYGFTAAGFDNLFVMIGMQIVWVILLYLISRAVWNIALKKFAGSGA